MTSILDSVAQRTSRVLGGLTGAGRGYGDPTSGSGASADYGDPYINYYAQMVLTQPAPSVDDVWTPDNVVDPMSAFEGMGGGYDPVAAAVNRTSGNPYAPKRRLPAQTGQQGASGYTNPYTDLSVRNVESTPQQEAFLQRFTPIAEQIESKYGIPMELTIAIAATETGWGAKVPPGNAWFGVKAQPGKPSTNFATYEYQNGQRVDQNADFTAYASPEEAADDFARLITGASRYRNVMELARQGRVSELPKALYDAGYATDPNIVRVYGDIMTQSNVNRNTNRFSKFWQQTESQGTGTAGNGSNPLGIAALKAGAKYIGTPYVFGGGRSGNTSNLDCSSFVSQAFKDVGVNLTPYTDAMVNETQAVDIRNLQPGDLVFWRWDDPKQPGTKYSHVGIYQGNGKVLNATNPGGVQTSLISDFAGTPVFRRVAKRG